MEEKKYAVCITNRKYEASLERWKVYVVIPDKKADRYNRMRIIDELGDSYLYPKEFFVPIELPKAVQEAMIADKTL